MKMFTISFDDDEEDSPCSDSDSDTITGDAPASPMATNRELLLKAIEEEDYIDISYYLSLQPHPDRTTPGEPSPLWMAIHKSTPDIVDILIRSGCSITEMQSPSSYFVKSSDYKYRGDNKSLSDNKGYTYLTKMTLLHWAIVNGSYEMVIVLLAHGASPNWVDERDNSVLQYAVESRSVQIAKELIKRGAKVNEPLFKYPGNFIIHDAVNSGSIPMVKMLLSYGADARVVNWKNQNVLHVLLTSERMARSERPDLVQILIDAGCPINHRLQSNYYSPLLLAVEQKRIKTMKILLKHNADPNCMDKWKKTFPLLVACGHRCPVMIRLLLESGANVDQKTGDRKQTALHVACELGHDDVVKQLIKFGADLDATDDRCKTPLHIAIEKNRYSIARLLLVNGANVELKDMDECTPLQCTTVLGLEKMAKLLLEFGADVHKDLFWGYTPLHTACKFNKLPLLKLFVRNGADINSKSSRDKLTPLHLAVEHSSTTLVEYLLRNGADVNCKDPDNETPIFKACGYHHAAKIKLLLDYGADLTVKNNFGNTPFCQLIYKPQEAGQIMIKHIALRLYKNEPVEECDLVALNDPDVNGYFLEALERVKILVEDKFFRNLTFFDILYMKQSELVQLVKNPNFVKAFQENYEKHNGYWNDLEIKFEKAVIKRELLYTMENHLDSLFGRYLPSAVIERLATFVIIEA